MLSHTVRAICSAIAPLPTRLTISASPVAIFSMPDTSNPTKRLRALATWTLLSAVIIVTIWLMIIVWWRTTQRVVSNLELVTCLVVLPLSAIGIFFVLSLVFKRMKNRVKPSEITPSSTGQSQPKSSRPADTLPILAAWAVTSITSDGEELVEALAERRARPMPDMLLSDEHGFPLLASRAPELDLSQIETMLATHVAENQMTSRNHVEAYSVACLRALALLGSTLDQVLDEWPLRDVDNQMHERAFRTATLRGSSGLPNQVIRPFVLQVKLIVAASLQVHEKVFAQACVEARLAPLNAGANVQVELVAAHDDATALGLANEFSRGSADTAGQALLLLACDSMLCPQLAEAWSTNGRLFGTRQPNGLMMGEAAFAILCVRKSGLDHALTEPICQLTPMYRAQRNTAADAPGRPSSACLTEQVDNALNASGVTRNEIGGVVCDADHRNGRTLECIGTMIEQTPRLDAIQNRLAINEACGHLGAASMTGVMAVAAFQATMAKHPVLLFNVSHSTDRAAAVMIPSERIDAELPPEHLQAA
jgi:hypothetical protein